MTHDIPQKRLFIGGPKDGDWIAIQDRPYIYLPIQNEPDLFPIETNGPIKKPVKMHDEYRQEPLRSPPTGPIVNVHIVYVHSSIQPHDVMSVLLGGYIGMNPIP